MIENKRSQLRDSIGYGWAILFVVLGTAPLQLQNPAGSLDEEKKTYLVEGTPFFKH